MTIYIIDILKESLQIKYGTVWYMILMEITWNIRK
jgi:hypothetical protein